MTFAAHVCCCFVVLCVIMYEVEAFGLRFDVCSSEVSTKIEDIRTIFEGEMSPHHPYK